MSAQFNNPDARQRAVGLPALTLLLCGFYLLWTLWAMLLIKCSSLDHHWEIRLLVRIAVWGAVVGGYVVAGGTIAPAIRFSRRGVIWGFATASYAIGRLVWSTIHNDSAPTMPDEGTLLNAVVVGPILEELIFRAIVFRELAARIGVVAGAIVSGALFALIHLPYWWLSHHMSSHALLLSLGGVFTLGVVLALIYRASNTLIAPIILHVLNNLASLAAP